MGTSDKQNTYNTNNNKGNSSLLSYKDIQTDNDGRMINYVLLPTIQSTRSPMVISYPNLLKHYTYLWN